MNTQFMTNYLLLKALRIKAIRRLLSNNSGELDEKALLIALFVIVCIAGLTTLGTAVAGRFTNLAGRL
jgi:Flp pilus assembly pilin Flp